MIPESAIARECFNKTFARARTVAKNGGFIFNRRCSYEPDYTQLRACMEASTWDDAPYDVRVDVSEELGQVLDYECTCPAHYRYPGMCKHAAGLCLLFNAEPQSFRGYSAVRAISTAPSIAALMKRLSATRSAAAGGAQLAFGSIDFELAVEVLDHGRYGASFKVCSPNSSYVLKDISAFLDQVETGAYHEYGKKLGFSHVRSAFSERGWQVVEWMQRVADANTSWWRKDSWSSRQNFRVMHVGPGQLIELIDLFEGDAVELTPYASGYAKAEPRTLVVHQLDPLLDMRLEPLEEGGFEIIRGAELGFAVYGQRVCAWDEHMLYRCSPRLGACAEFLEEVYGGGEQRLTLGDEDAPLFCKTLLPLLQEHLQVEVPPQMEAMKPVEGRVEFYLDADGGQAECRARVLYGQAEYALLVPGNQPGKPARDEDLEAGAREALGRYLPLVREDGTALTQGDDDLARLLFYGVDELARWGELYCTDAFTRRKAPARSSVQAGLSIDGQLLRLSFDAGDMSPAELAALLQSYTAKKTYHKLRDGSFVNLQDAAATSDLARLELIAQELGLSARDIARGDLQAPSYHAFLLDSLAGKDEKEESFLRFVEAFEDRRGKRYELPASLQGVLRPYQEEGFAWLSTLADNGLAGILADEMGLGKSLQTIAVLLSRAHELQQAPALVVCPASLVYNWQAEFAKFGSQLQVAVLAGPKRQRDELLARGGYQVLVTSYDTLRVDIDGIAQREFSFQVIDEAQYIKNHATKAARAVKAVSAAHRIALTGTPIENRLSELWSIFDYLMPGMLGPYRRFRERYEAPILAGDDEASALLGAKVGPFILRRLKADVLADLPEKLESVVHAKLEGEQRRLYSAHEARLLQALTEGDDGALAQGRIAVLAELTKLRQLCCDPRLLYEDASQPGAKLAAIAQLVESAHEAGQKALVFSQFTSFLELIAAELSAHGWDYYTITGATPKEERLRLVERFNADEVPVFLISLKAGGTGLNLTGASVVIHADPWWNAAAQNQATDRAHRIGQTRDVSVFKVIADGTIEERIVRLQEAKSSLADAVLGADSASLAALSRDELIELLAAD